MALCFPGIGNVWLAVVIWERGEVVLNIMGNLIPKKKYHGQGFVWETYKVSELKRRRRTSDKSAARIDLFIHFSNARPPLCRWQLRIVSEEHGLLYTRQVVLLLASLRSKRSRRRALATERWERSMIKASGMYQKTCGCGHSSTPMLQCICI